MKIEHIATLPDGDAPVGIVNYRDRIIVAGQSGRIYELGREPDGYRLKCIDLLNEGIEESFKQLQAEGRIEVRPDGSARFIPPATDSPDR